MQCGVSGHAGIQTVGVRTDFHTTVDHGCGVCSHSHPVVENAPAV